MKYRFYTTPILMLLCGISIASSKGWNHLSSSPESAYVHSTQNAIPKPPPVPLNQDSALLTPPSVFSTTPSGAPGPKSRGLPAGSSEQKTEALIPVDLFMTSTCSHCHKADEYLQSLEKNTKWIKLNRYVINEDKKALAVFYDRLNALGSTNFSVPTIIFCDSRWLGFDNAENSGKSLVHALNFCRENLNRDGYLKKATRNTLRQWSATSSGNMNLEINQPVSSLMRVVILACVESFSPCSLFCFLFLLAFFWLHPTCRISRFLLGMTFIVAFAFIHTVQFVWTSQYQQWSLYLPWVTRVYAFLLLFYLVRYVQTRAEGATSDSLGWALLIVIFGVIVLYTQQQTCDFSAGAIFQRWLVSQTLTPAAVAFYQGTYLFFYLMPLMLILAIYSLFSVRPRNLLPATAALILVVIDVLLLIYPAGLANMGLSFAVLVFSMIAIRQYLKRVH
jgi:hypothetical protein